MEFMCMQMENHAPLQEGDNSKIKTFSISFSKTTIMRIKIRSFDPFPLDPLVVI